MIDPSRSTAPGRLTRSRPLDSRPEPSSAATEMGRRITYFVVAAVLSVAAGLSVVYFHPAIVFGAVIACLFVLLILRWPFLGLMLYLLIYLLRIGELYPALAPLRAERLVGILTLFSFLFRQIQQDGRISFDRSKQTRRLLFLQLAAFASIPFAYWRLGAWNGSIDLLRIVIFYFLIVQIVDTKARLRKFVFLYSALIAYIAYLATYDYLHGAILFAQDIERAIGATSAGGGPNELGATMATTIPLFLLLSFHKPLGRWRVLFLVGLGLLVFTLITTGSRSGVLGFLAGIGYLWWRSRHRLVLGVVGIVMVAALFVVMPEQYKGRYQTMAENPIEGTGNERLMVWGKGLRMAADHPLFGVGISCFGTANALGYSGGSRRSYLESHSLYVQIPAELGLVGALAFFGFILEIIRLNRRTAQAVADHPDWQLESLFLTAMQAGIAALLVTGVFGHSLMRPTWYIYAALGVTVVRVYITSAKNLTEDAREALIG